MNSSIASLPPRFLPRLGSSALVLGLLMTGARAQSIFSYDASTGKLPESPCWKLIDTANPEQPLVAGGKLTLSSSADAENMFFLWDSKLNFPAKLVFEARMRRVSGSSSHTARTPAVMGVTTLPGVGNALFIGQDEIFLLAGNLVKGASASLDTDDLAHTYRMEVTGTAQGSQIEVFYDSETSPRLQGTTFFDTSANGLAPRLQFGEASNLSWGTSEWEWVSHNAGPASCCGGANSCGKISTLGSVGLPSGGTYDTGSGSPWTFVLPDVPAAPSPGLLIYGMGPTNPVTPLETAFGNLCVGPFFRASVAVPDVTAGGCAVPTQYTWTTWSAYVDANKAAGAQGFSAGGVDEVWIQAWHRDPVLPAGAVLSKLAGPFFVAP